jgi:c-di-AMP phosphodiesterase-like protein
MHWSTAHDALRRAERVFIIGYSFPQTDLIGSALIGPWLLERRVTVVNRSPDPVVDRIRSLTNDTAVINVVDGEDAVAKFADEYATEFDRALKPPS